jgi:hypothetical protein
MRLVPTCPQIYRAAVITIRGEVRPSVRFHTATPSEYQACRTGCAPVCFPKFVFMVVYRPDRRMYPIASIARQKPHAGPLAGYLCPIWCPRAAFYCWNNDKRSQKTMMTPAAKRMNFRLFSFLSGCKAICGYPAISRLILCTVPVPSPTSLATFRMPVPLRRCRCALRSSSLVMGGLPRCFP